MSWETEQLGDYPSVRRSEFLQSCKAERCTSQDYAIWLSQFLEEGGKVTHFYTYPFGGDSWVKPTISAQTPIPTGCGTDALQLVILPSTGNVPLDPTSRDHRRGWEWGHTQLFALIEGEGGVYAYTNKPNVVPCYPDIIPLLSENVQPMLHQIAKEEVRKAIKRERERRHEEAHILPLVAAHTSTMPQQSVKSAYEIGASVLNAMELPYKWRLVLPLDPHEPCMWTGIDPPKDYQPLPSKQSAVDGAISTLSNVTLRLQLCVAAVLILLAFVAGTAF